MLKSHREKSEACRQELEKILKAMEAYSNRLQLEAPDAYEDLGRINANLLLRRDLNELHQELRKFMAPWSTNNTGLRDLDPPPHRPVTLPYKEASKEAGKERKGNAARNASLN